MSNTDTTTVAPVAAAPAAPAAAPVAAAPAPAPATPAAAPAAPVEPAAAPVAAAPSTPALAQPAAPAVLSTTPAPAPAPAAPTIPASNVEAQSWRNGIVDPKNKEYAARFTSPDDMVSTVLKMRDDLSKRIKPLAADATPEDRAAYNKAMGVPATPTDYKFTLHENLKMGEADEAILNQILPVAHASGVPNSVMNDFVAKFMEVSKGMEAQTIAQINDFGKAAETQLKAEWGQDFEVNLGIANRAAAALGGPAFKAFLNETVLPGGKVLGDHPMMVKTLATIGRRFGEGDMVLGATPQERATIQQQLDQLNKDVPVGSKDYTSQAHQAKLTELYGKLSSGNIVGANQRVA